MRRTDIAPSLSSSSNSLGSGDNATAAGWLALDQIESGARGARADEPTALNRLNSAAPSELRRSCRRSWRLALSSLRWGLSLGAFHPPFFRHLKVSWSVTPLPPISSRVNPGLTVSQLCTLYLAAVRPGRCNGCFLAPSGAGGQRLRQASWCTPAASACGRQAERSVPPRVCAVPHHSSPWSLLILYRDRFSRTRTDCERCAMRSALTLASRLARTF